MPDCSSVIFTGYARPCGREATRRIGDLWYCWQHRDQLWQQLADEIQNGDGQFRAQARAALYNFDRVELDRQEAELDARRRASSVVYFVERDGFIKIGTTTQIASRLAALSKGGQMPEGMTVGPVTLLATMPGGRRNEAHLHRRFADHRISRTEWFWPCDELVAFISGLKGQGALADSA